MVQLRLELRNDEALRRLLENIDPGESPAWVMRALVAAGLRVQRNAATKQIRRGGKGKPLPRKITSRTGTGRRSIRVDRGGLNRLFVDVGSDLAYMAVHETGGTFLRRAHTRLTPSGGLARVRAHSATFPQRPWLAPALDEENAEMGNIFVREWEREANRS